MRTAIEETDRRRAIQVAYNEEHGITPETIQKGISDISDFLMTESKVPAGRGRRQARHRGDVGRGPPPDDRGARGGDAGRGRRPPLRVRRQAARRDQVAAARAGAEAEARAPACQLGLLGVPPGVRRAGCALVSGLAARRLVGSARAAAPRSARARRSPCSRWPAARSGSPTGSARSTCIPGQNSIGLRADHASGRRSTATSRASGPNLTYLDGTRAARRRDPPAPRRLGEHLAAPTTRASAAELFFAAGEEKTTLQLPKGYGYPLGAPTACFLNHMIHNLTPTPDAGVHDLPDRLRRRRARAAARGIRPVRPIWMDVERGKTLSGLQRPQGLRQAWPLHLPGRRQEPLRRRAEAEPVGGRQAGRAGRHRRPPASRRAPHGPARLRPAAGRTRRRLFRSRAKYFEPAGAVSWDVAMTGTPQGLEGEGPEGRRALGERHLRHQARLLVGVHGDHGHLHGRRRAREEPVQDRSVDRRGR